MYYLSKIKSLIYTDMFDYIWLDLPIIHELNTTHSMHAIAQFCNPIM